MQETRAFIPVGFKFRPSDQELIEHYLYSKVFELPIPCDIVRECDLYGSQEPWEIWESFGGPGLNADEDLYFFTRLKKKTSKGSRICRIIGSGAWQGEDAGSQIVSPCQVVIGLKKRYRYENKGCRDSGCWIMHEYSLDSSVLGQKKDTDYVLCRIRKNHGKEKISASAKRRKLQDVESAEPEGTMVMRVLKDEASYSSEFQGNGEIYHSEPGRFLIPQDQNHPLKLRVDNQSEAKNPMEKEAPGCTTDMMMISDQIVSQVPFADFAVTAQNYQNSNMQSSMPERFLIPQENQQQQQMVWVNNVGSYQYEQDNMVPVLEPELPEDPLAGISDEDLAFVRQVFCEPGYYQLPTTICDGTSETLQQQYFEDVFFSIDELCN